MPDSTDPSFPAAADTAYFDTLSPTLRVTTAVSALLRALTDLRLTRAELLTVLGWLLAVGSQASLPAKHRRVDGKVSAKPLKQRLQQLAHAALSSALEMPQPARQLTDRLAQSLRA